MNFPASARDSRDEDSIPRLGRCPGVGNGNPTPIFLPGESHGQRNLEGHSPWGHKKLDMTEHTEYIYPRKENLWKRILGSRQKGSKDNADNTLNLKLKY